jgi:hypothetical protein
LLIEIELFLDFEKLLGPKSQSRASHKMEVAGGKRAGALIIQPSQFHCGIVKLSYALLKQNSLAGYWW